MNYRYIFMSILSAHILMGSVCAQDGFVLITTLYNEKKPYRRSEFVTCLEKNLRHPLIDAIHVIYDNGKDGAEGSELLDYLKTKKIDLSYISGRTSYGDVFKIANKLYPNRRIIVANADIFFNDTLRLLDPYDLRGKFLALTRWDVQPDGSLVEFSPCGTSQDVWIFQTPLRRFENDSIKMGILGCEHAIAYQAQESGLELYNPAYSIQCCHLHISAVRNYTQDRPYAHMGRVNVLHKCHVIELDPRYRGLYLEHLLLRAGRRRPIILS